MKLGDRRLNRFLKICTLTAQHCFTQSPYDLVNVNPRSKAGGVIKCLSLKVVKMHPRHVKSELQFSTWLPGKSHNISWTK